MKQQMKNKPSFFAQEHHIILCKKEFCLKILRKIPKSRSTVKTDVGQIADIMPAGKSLLVGDELSHNSQPSARFQQRKQGGPLSIWISQVFDDLGGGDKIIFFVKNAGIIGVKWIVQIHLMAMLFYQLYQRRSGAAAEIKTVLLRATCQLVQQWSA